MNGRIFIVDDDISMCEMLAVDLRQRGFAACWRTSAEEAIEALNESAVDVILCDLRMPGMDGIELCGRIVAGLPEVPVVVMTAFGSLDTAVSAIRAGAYDFVTKPFEMEALALVLERAVKYRTLKEQVKTLSEAFERSTHFDALVGKSPQMKSLYAQLDRIAATEAAVLVTGESGTGKELVARALHKHSAHQAGPFVAVNCAALSETLIESELFGHRKGAFTDAKTSRKGVFLEAEGGTLLLDEIGELPLPLQSKLLRVLDEKSVRPVGGEGNVPFNVRIVAATNRDLDSAVAEKRFREDLFFRIDVVRVHVPPLRARGTDILLLARHFLEKSETSSGKGVTGLSEAVGHRLLSYPWPGNVRELRNVMEHAVALTRTEKLVVEDLPEKLRTYESSHVLLTSSDPGELVPMEEVERRYIKTVLDAVGGNRTLAARILGFDRKTLYRKLQHYSAQGSAGV